MTEPSASSASADFRHQNLSAISDNNNNGPTDDPQPSESPPRPSPIVTEELGPSLDPIDDATSSATSPLSALSTPPDSPIEDAAPLLPTPNGNTHAELNDGQINGHVHTAETPDGEPPAKRRRVRDATPPPPASMKSRKTLVESPPWKKFEAEGPTTFVENGKRKSGRINAVPLAVQGSDKRITRKSYLHSSPPSKNKYASSHGHTPSRQATNRSTSAVKPATSRSTPAVKAPARKSLGAEPRSTPKNRRPSSPPVQPSRSSARTQRPSRTARDSLEHDSHATPPTRTTPRIKLRVNRPPLTELPLLHPERVPKKKLATSLEEYFQNADNIPVVEGGQLVLDEEPPFTEEMAHAEAKTILRIENEARPGGLLGENCSVFEPEPAEELPRQFAHLDHLIKAALNLRKWMVREQRDHREKAKRLAEACQQVWKSRQPKTEEELEREAREMWTGRYRLVMKAMYGMWENVKIEVNRRRLEEWEAEEQRRVKAALQEAVSRSEQQLLARQAQFDSDITDDEHLDEDDEDADMDEEHSRVSDDDEEARAGSTSDGDEDMSSSDEDDDRKSVASDEGLTQEQLREKYANLPDLKKGDDQGEGTDASMVDADTGLDDETSDESIDMDDDMGSSDEDSDASGSGKEEEESGDGEDQPSGLLGLFFGKKELKKLQVEAPADESEGKPEGGDTKTVDADTPVPPFYGEQSAKTEEVSDSAATTEVNGIADAQKSPAETVTNNSVDKEPDSATVKSLENSPTTTPGIAMTPSALDAVRTTPEADMTTNLASPDRSPSPITTDTKPSDVDTATSVEHLSAPHDGSRSASPQPNAPRTEVPFLLRGQLREYQHYGLDWLAGLYANNTNGILADEMGLGKTIQTIALLAHLACEHEVWGPHLVIVPTSVMLNWEMEFKKWCPGFKILTYYGTQDERKRKRQGWTNDDVWNVCITSYQIVLQDNQVFRRRRWHYMILDEAHNIKNFRSQRWQTLLGFNTHSRLLLTGTPLQNNLTELWSLLFFLTPSGGFADLKEFHDWFAKPESQILENGREQMDDEARAIIAKLHKVLRPYLLRRLKADVEKQMPAKIEHVEFCRLSKRQRELYDGFLARSETRETLSSGNYLSIINCLMQLRKVCNHPDLFVDRPIMTSVRMDKSVAAGYEVTEQLVRNKLLAEKPMSVVSLSFLNLVPTQHEDLSNATAERTNQLSAHRALMDLRETQKLRSQASLHTLDPSTIKSIIGFVDSAARWGRFEELQHCVYLNAFRRQQRPIYGKRLREFLTIGVDKRPYKPRPRVPKQVMSWFEEDSFVLHTMIPTLDQRAKYLESTISKFACVTPAVVTRDMERFVLGSNGVQAFEEADLKLSAPVRRLPFIPKEPPIDPWHESRMRLSIQFPDKRLLQYDCGKLQALDKLLRKLQAGGHRALIFTQMTKVLDILERFLNIHGHKYLRLDGATKVEQRQILTDRFNVDTRILCFILSTRSGGLGLNLTGADTVIFYDQDWNPAMDKQCQDRCHRIGQTRDVHIYRLVSEHTIEANILRKAGQKQMLDDVVIQEGEFTTDYFNNRQGRLSVHDVGGLMGENDAAANAAMDLVLGGVETTDTRTATKALEHAEDTEDVVAARAAEKEIQQDDADFSEKPGSGAVSTRQGTPREGSVAPGRSGLGLFSESAEIPAIEEVESQYNAWSERIHNIDEFMLATMAKQLEGTPLELPKDKKKGKKKGRDTRKR